MSNKILLDAYLHCQNIAAQHYENFPVASKFLAKKIRQPLSVIYAFARTADDFADEGNYTKQQRFQLLANYRQQLNAIEENITPTEPIFIALAEVIKQFKLPIKLFHDLIDAFEQDVTQQTYQDEQQLLQYCQKSANPIGRLMLHLYDKASQTNLQYSDKICTALQLINFSQDIQQDAVEHNRNYIPLDNTLNLDINPQQLMQRIKCGRQYNNQEIYLIKQQITRAEKLLVAGKPLIKNLSGRFKFEISLIYYSALTIIEKLKKSHAFCDRPRLNKLDKLAIFYNSSINQWRTLN